MAAYSLVAGAAAWLGGISGCASAGVAAGLCLLGAEVALVVCHLLRGSKYEPYAMLAGMLPRMGIPLMLGLVLQIRGGILAENGLLIYLVVFYPVTLAVESAMSLPPADNSLPPADHAGHGTGSRGVVLRHGGSSTDA